MKWQVKVTLVSGLFLAASLSIPLYAQDSVSLQPVAMRTSTENPAAAPAKTKPKKVWTEDSISEVRTPADNYQDEKAATAQAQASANSAAGSATKTAAHKGPGAPPLVLHIPKTPEDTQKAIDQRTDLADDFSRLLSNAQERLQTESDPQVRATLLEKAKLLTLDINTTNSEIKTLQKALGDYQHGKTPEQPKTESNAAAPADQPKPNQ